MSLRKIHFSTKHSPENPRHISHHLLAHVQRCPYSLHPRFVLRSNPPLRFYLPLNTNTCMRQMVRLKATPSTQATTFSAASHCQITKWALASPYDRRL